MPGVTVRIFKNRLDELLTGASGPVVLHQANVGRQVAGAARRLAPRDTGTLAGSIDSRLAGMASGGRTVEVVASAPYALYVHQGNRAHWPPPGAVAGWASRHGFPAQGGAFLVARAISRRARAPNRFLLEAARSVGLDARARR